MARRRLGFRGRQIAAMTAVAAIVALVTSGLSAALMVGSSVDQIRNGAELVGRTLYHQIGFVIRENWGAGVPAALAADPGLRRIADSVVGYSPVTVYVAVVDEGERVLFHSDPDLHGRVASAEASLAEFARRNALAQTWLLATRSNVLVLDQPFSIDGQHPFGVVRVAVSTVLLREKLSGVITRNTVFSGGVVLLAFGVSFFVADRILAPVERLRAELARIDVGEGPLDLQTEDDASRIAALFSSMARELGRRQSTEGGQHYGPVDVGDGVAVLSADGRALMTNDAAERLMRGSERNGPLRKLVETVTADRRPAGPERFALGAGECVVQAWPLPVDREAAAVVTLRDAEQLSRLADELSHSRKLGAVGRISSGVTHEVKNALNAITMHAELLRRRIDDDESVDVLDKELRRLGRMVETFLEFTRQEEVDFRPVELTRVIDEVVQLVSGRLEADRIRLDVETSAGSLSTTGDAELLRQALLNLVLNACEAMPEGGTLRIVAASDEESRQSILRVEDTGVGIPRERLERIFELFHSTKPGGSGIGLSTVYRIVHLHGGKIEVDSETGKGSCFTISLPRGTI